MVQKMTMATDTLEFYCAFEILKLELANTISKLMSCVISGIIITCALDTCVIISDITLLFVY